MRVSSKNMCSVRQRPMPSAPKPRAVLASSGVSALARTFIRRFSSAQPISFWKSDDSSGSIIGMAPRITSPEEPSMVIVSPALKLAPRAEKVRAFSLMWISPAPLTHGRPMPRATTAAWLVMPPRQVTTPLAACMP